MKKLRGLLVIALILVTAVLLNNTKSFAAEVQYTGNVIPTMTSDTSPNGVASASNIYNSTFPAWKAFDKNISTAFNGWVTANGRADGLLEYDFTIAKSITKYTIISRSGTIPVLEMPKDWTFEAYDETLAKWVILDTHTNVINWSYLVKKEFTFTNSNSYKKYRLNILNNGGAPYTSLGELEMMETIPSQTNLTATVEKTNANLSWTPVTNVHYYNIKRSTTPGGPYTTIATGSAISFTDEGLQPGTYYYVVSTVISGMESTNSNEVSVITSDEPSNPVHEGNYSTLIISMTNGDDKVYNLSLVDLDNFLNWYDSKSDGTGKAYYVFTKTESIAPYVSIKDYISFDKISSFEVKEYNQ